MPTKETTESEVKTPTSTIPYSLQGILIKPRISEKSARANQEGKYIFEVFRKANKVNIKKAIEKSFNVNVVSVNIVTMEGKKRNFGKTFGKRSDFKKAIVTLKKGQTIDTPEAKI